MVEENKTFAGALLESEMQAAEEAADSGRRPDEAPAAADLSSPAADQPARIPPSPPPRLHVPPATASNAAPDKMQPTCSGVSNSTSNEHSANGFFTAAESEGSSSGGGGDDLVAENQRLKREVEELKNLLGTEAASLSTELIRTKDALSAAKADKKRLTAEKYDLLNQMKQLYSTLDDKENELREFIRSYQQIRDTEASSKKLATEREEWERERWTLLRHAREEAERSMTLAAQLTAREAQIQQLQDHIMEMKRSTGYVTDQESRVNGGSGTPMSSGLLGGLVGSGLPGDRGSSADSGVRGSSDRESGATSAGGGNLSDSNTDGTPTITVEAGAMNNIDMDSISVVSSLVGHNYQTASSPKESPTLSPMSANPFSRMIEDNSVLSRSVEQLQDSEPMTCRRKGMGRLGRGGTWGSISRVFTRNRHRKMASPGPEGDSYRSWSPLTEEGYAEKLRLLREASTVPMERWRAPTVLAWLEVALGMPQYGPRCSENIKSGKVLLELSDVELDVGLGITHPMHRKKLRLAIEEHRHPSLVRYPCMAQLGHTWVSSEWLPDLGLAQYSENFATNMVDARMLDHLSKKELEKFLNVTRKFHQASIVHGIHLLRMLKYDRQALAVRRHQCENMDADPIVWTNQRFVRWARNIDLIEYADNLKDSGVHGALVVLEPSFNGDTMASAMGIPQSKNIIRRHLSTELEALILPARTAVEHYMKISKMERRRYEKLMSGGSLGRSFSRSYAGGLQDHQYQEQLGALSEQPNDKDRGRKASLRGSLSKALGLTMRGKHSHQQQHHPHHQHHHHHHHHLPHHAYQHSEVGGGASPDSSLASPTSEVYAGAESAESTPHGLPASSSSTSSGSTRHLHRRVRSIGDIEFSATTPV